MRLDPLNRLALACRCDEVYSHQRGKLRQRELKRERTAAEAHRAAIASCWSAAVGWRIRPHPPLSVPLTQQDDTHELVARTAFEAYKMTIPKKRRAARPLSAGRCRVQGGRCRQCRHVLRDRLFTNRDDATLLLQMKEAQQSVLAPYAGPSVYLNQGQRVVTGQRIMQGGA